MNKNVLISLGAVAMLGAFSEASMGSPIATPERGPAPYSYKPNTRYRGNRPKGSPAQRLLKAQQEDNKYQLRSGK